MNAVFRTCLWLMILAGAWTAPGAMAATGPATATAAPPLVAGFDCARVLTQVERTLCAQPELALQDYRLGLVYRRLHEQLRAPARSRLLADQGAWLRRVRDRCADAACLSTAYLDRLARLQAWPQTGPDATRQVALGAQHSCALTVAGAVWCRGFNAWGQVGNGKPGAPVVQPVRVIARGATHVAAGPGYSCAIVAGALYCWGRVSYSAAQDGAGAEAARAARPARIIARGVTGVSIGRAHACAVVSDSLQCWGRNNHNQIGRAAQASELDRPGTVIPSGVSAVSAGEHHTCAIVGGGLSCWGYNYSGQVGNGTSGEHVPEPEPIFDTGVTWVSAGSDHTCAVVGDGLYCWGDGRSGSLGIDKPDSGKPFVTRPALVMRGSISAVAADPVRGRHTCALVDAALYCWGENDLGQIGHGPPAVEVVRRPLKVLERGVTSIAVNNGRTCAVVNGTEQCWRYGTHGAIVARPPTAAIGRPGPAGTGVARYAGTFNGYICNFGQSVTRLFLDGQGALAGEYARLPEDPATAGDSGTLDECQVLAGDAVQCTWHDRHGVGGMIVQFDEDATEFRGNWGTGIREGDSFPPTRLKRDDWLGEVSCWSGVRQ